MPFLLRGATRLREGHGNDPVAWAKAFQAGCAAVAELGDARPGDRTMLDALVPAAEAFHGAVTSGVSVADALWAAAAAAATGAAATATLLPRRGRSAYLGERVLGQRDPGAEAAAAWLAALVPR